MLVFAIVSLLPCIASLAQRPTSPPHDTVEIEGSGMGYIVERYGTVMQQETKCAEVLFGFDGWLSSWTFPNEAKRIASNRPISEYNALSIILDKTRVYTPDIRALYINLTSPLGECKRNVTTTRPKVPVPTKLHDMEQKRDPSMDDHITTMIKTDHFKKELEDLMKSYKMQLRDVIFALKRRNLDSSAILYLGGEEFYRSLAREILGSQFKGGLVDELGTRTAALTEISILGTVGQYDIAIEVCMPTLHRRQGLPLYYIHPWGTLTGSIYTRPLFPLMYAQGFGHHGINELLVAEGVLLSNREFTVVTTMRDQSRDCRLSQPSKCFGSMIDINNDIDNGTVVIPLKTKHIIVTVETHGFCIYEDSAVKEFNITHPVLVREPAGCMVKVGNKTFGAVFQHFLAPEPAIVFYDPTNDISKWESKEAWKNYFWSLALPSSVVLLAFVVILGFCCMHCHVKSFVNMASSTKATVDSFQSSFS